MDRKFTTVVLLAFFQSACVFGMKQKQTSIIPTPDKKYLLLSGIADQESHLTQKQINSLENLLPPNNQTLPIRILALSALQTLPKSGDTAVDFDQQIKALGEQLEILEGDDSDKLKQTFYLAFPEIPVYPVKSSETDRTQYNQWKEIQERLKLLAQEKQAVQTTLENESIQLLKLQEERKAIRKSLRKKETEIKQAKGRYKEGSETFCAMALAQKLHSSNLDFKKEELDEIFENKTDWLNTIKEEITQSEAKIVKGNLLPDAEKAEQAKLDQLNKKLSETQKELTALARDKKLAEGNYNSLWDGLKWNFFGSVDIPTEKKETQDPA